MPFISTPVVDESNPCYCPNLSVAQYLGRLHVPLADNDELCEDDVKIWGKPLDFHAIPDSDAFEPPKLRLSYAIQPRSFTLEFPKSFSLSSASASSGTLTSASSNSVEASSIEHRLSDASRHARSSLVIANSSYELEGRASPISTFFPCRTGHSPSTSDVLPPSNNSKILEDALYGPGIGPETVGALRILILRLCHLLPGIRLRDRLQMLEPLTHQSIIDALGNDGLLNDRVLELFRRSEIWRIDLSASFKHENGLNLAGTDTLKVLAKPNGFQCLTELDISEVLINDFDLTHVHHLPRLTTLILNNTGVGNEALCHIVALRHTLAYLHLENNEAVDDVGVPALLLLGKLQFLSLLGTGVGMPGLRSYALAARGRRVDLLMPAACEAYLTRLAGEYALAPAPPLITDAGAARALSAAALRANLTAHAAHNAGIVTGGSKAEMAARLSELLTRRAADCAVRAMLWGEDDGESEAGVTGTLNEDMEE